MEPDAPSGPFRMGPFEVQERLGRGGFASVYRARDQRTGQSVALKVVPAGTDAETVRRLMREARAVARVSHPNVVRVYECGETAEGAYVAMELLVGQTLQDLIDDVGPLPVPRALEIALQVLDGLDVAHQNHIVHRDIKPGNIFLTRDAEGNEVPHLLDFGVSKVGAPGGVSAPTSHADRTMPGTSMGTPGFMAPEQYGSAHAADARADVYGVAATIYAMLTGRLPFDAGTYESWVIKVKGERAPSVASKAPHVVPDVAMAIDRALARDPDARWSTARDFARALAGHASTQFGATTRRDRFPSVAPSLAPSTPRTETEALPSTQPAPPSAVRAGARRSDPVPRPLGPPRAKKPSTPRGLWFAWGALAGALLAGLGAGVVFWARGRAPNGAPRATVSDAGGVISAPETH